MHTQNIHSKAFTPLWGHITHCKGNVSTYPTLPSSLGICCDPRSLRAPYLFSERGFGSIRWSLVSVLQSVLQSDQPLKTNIWENHPPLIHKKSAGDFSSGTETKRKGLRGPELTLEPDVSLIKPGYRTQQQDGKHWKAEMCTRDKHWEDRRWMEGQRAEIKEYWGTILGRTRGDGERGAMQGEFQDIPQFWRPGRSQDRTIN